jgi:hypothetical protein
MFVARHIRTVLHGGVLLFCHLKLELRAVTRWGNGLGRHLPPTGLGPQWPFAQSAQSYIAHIRYNISSIEHRISRCGYWH